MKTEVIGLGHMICSCNSQFFSRLQTERMCLCLCVGGGGEGLGGKQVARGQYPKKDGN